ncbi:hypothetical protein M427DRAFT_26983 [Gonapodya prolifera JEL478]|uniref:Presequence translocated-associated motor subunit PAM17 n=1 Tax=Gonapodya prolifera (strain JEL478) TaxID=1344416 RepID=A0A139B140_GONPJ|nr:hypothetical protein M427DRAFT_26983 [Gonapodya prolifera JEL478]|eukprot:KXS22425.1 hypothetical protein M427DRAFT_26983 [Gonapodya prolifera JEL478]
MAALSALPLPHATSPALALLARSTLVSLSPVTAQHPSHSHSSQSHQQSPLSVAQKSVRFASTVTVCSFGLPDGANHESGLTLCSLKEDGTSTRRGAWKKRNASSASRRAASAAEGKEAATDSISTSAVPAQTVTVSRQPASSRIALPSLRSALLLNISASARLQSSQLCWQSSRAFSSTSVSHQDSSASSSSSAPTTPPSNDFNWTTYFQMRRQRHRAEQVAGVVGGVAAFAGALYYVVVVMPFDPTVQLFGILGPEVVGSLGIIFAAVVGRWAGVLAGGEVWAAQNRQIMSEFVRRDKSFGRRINEQRAPQQALNVSSQHPDYYAEQVDSVQTYHRWLRQQRDYERGKEAKGAAGVVAALGRMPGMGGLTARRK